MGAPGTNRGIYWAGQEPRLTAQAALEWAVGFHEYLRTSGLHELWARSYRAYHGGAVHKGRIRRGGKQDQYHLLGVNHYRNLLQHLHVMTVGQRPNWEAQAANADKRSMGQAQLAQSLLDYYMRVKSLERVFKDAVEYALMYGHAWVLTEWDPAAGATYAANPDTGAPVPEGDLRYTVLRPSECVVDFTRDSARDSRDWAIVLTYRNRFDLAAQYPELADRLIALPTRFEAEWRKRDHLEWRRWRTDDVSVYRLLHARTRVMPDGRLLEFCDPDTVLTDGPLPYDDRDRGMPLRRIAGGELDGTPFGYTLAYDLLPAQEAAERLYSTIITNQSHYGVQNIAVPRGSGTQLLPSLVDGLNLLEFDPKTGPPQPLQLTATPAEVFAFLRELIGDMETISGVNAVARGEPPDQLKSGAALALVQSMAIQFSMGLQQSYAQLHEDVGTDTVDILRTFARTRRTAAIAGQSQRNSLVDFTGDDLAEVKRVTVDMGNPMLATTAGKVELAQQLLQAGMVRNPEQFIELLTTGRMEPLLEGEQAALQLIRAENEALAQGQPVQALATDQHILHVSEHLTVLASPEARAEPALVQGALAHITEHLTLAQQLALTNPMLAGLVGVPAAAQPTAPLASPGGAESDASAPLTPGTGSAPGQAGLPSMPINPLTGQRAQAAGGA